MRKAFFYPAMPFVLGVTLAAAVDTHYAFAAQLQPVAAPAATQPSPAELRIADAKQQLAADPKRPQTYNELALAYIRRARESSNSAYLNDAEHALGSGLKLSPDDFQLAKTGVALMLSRGQNAEALARARQLNAKMPDDVTIYGYIAEASIALGDYTSADKAAQLMLNMRANNLPGLVLGAQLRDLYGDASGSVDLLKQAYGETPPTETEELAWIATQIAQVELNAGHADVAAHILDQAMQTFPQAAYTRAVMARIRMAQGKPREAVTILEAQLSAEQSRQSTEAQTLFLLATAEQQAGDARATATYQQFATAARASSTARKIDAAATLELVEFDAGLPGRQPDNAAEALVLAERAIAKQQDVATLDAYAWALYANHRYTDAAAASAKALAVGVQRAPFAEHAGRIALALKQPEQAAQDFATTLQLDRTSAYAADARTALGAREPAIAASALATAPAIAPVAQAQGQPVVVPLREVQDTGSVPATLLVPRPTGTERAIHKLQAAIAARPNDAKSYAELGAGFFQRARETGDVEDYQLAEQALHKSLDLVGSDLSSTAPLETLAEVCMGEHRFSDALDYAQKALALGSGDLSAFAIVGDAEADMGSYAKAGAAYARLQPTSQVSPVATRESYAQEARTAYLQFVSGNPQDAIRQMELAVSEGLQAQLPGENLAWLYYELGEFRYQAGQVQPAANAYLTALTIYPGDYRALAGLGKVRASQGNYAAAVTLYNSAIAVVPMPLYVAELGDVYTRMGDTVDAEKQYKLVEYIGLLGHINQVLHNRDLALFYADHDRKLPEALTLARKEFEVRSDIYTWDALAWALYKNGSYAEAGIAMGHATQLGTEDAMLLFHTGMIDAKLGHASDASKNLAAALKLNPHFHVLYAGVATEQLALLQKQGASLAASPKPLGVPDAH